MWFWFTHRTFYIHTHTQMDWGLQYRKKTVSPSLAPRSNYGQTSHSRNYCLTTLTCADRLGMSNPYMAISYIDLWGCWACPVYIWAYLCDISVLEYIPQYIAELHLSSLCGCPGKLQVWLQWWSSDAWPIASDWTLYCPRYLALQTRSHHSKFTKLFNRKVKLCLKPLVMIWDLSSKLPDTHINNGIRAADL